MERILQRDVLTPEQIFENLRTMLEGASGADSQVLAVLRDDLLHVQVDVKESPRTALEKLLTLANSRAAAVGE